MIKYITLALLLTLASCTTPPEPNRCAQWQKAVELYDLAVLSGHQPSEDEIRIVTTARALIAVYCDVGAKLVPVQPYVKALPLPKQPKRITTLDETGYKVIYYLHIPFSVIQDPTGVYVRKESMATITIGPLYRTADPSRKQYLWLPDQAYLQGLTKTPTMLPIR